VDDPRLRYHALGQFDRAMLDLDIRHNLLGQSPIEKLHVHEDRKLLVVRRGPLVLAFNFHPHHSYPDYRVGVPEPTDYRLLLSTDHAEFGGHGQVLPDQVYACQTVPWDDRPQSIQIYVPSRTALVLAPNA
jgi:1,4-alpha-glucan branching enzyme